MDIVAIDPSLVCTALVINDKKFVYTGTHISHTEKGKMKRWFQEFDDIVTIRSFDLSVDGSLTHTEQENAKLSKYIKIVDCIIGDILFECADHTTARVAIEGYSYSSAAGPLIDLVTFGSILRYRLLSSGVAKLIIIPPQELKTKAASLSYPAIKKGKVTKYVNDDGKSAGSFKKRDMLQCLIDVPNSSADSWIERLREHKDELLNLKATPKPLEDVNDAKLLYEWLLRNP